MNFPVLRSVKSAVLISALLFSGAMMSQAHASAIQLGVAGDYSGFFFGDVNAASDVEGRLAVGGNLNMAFSIGYRNPFGSTLPSLVVGGDVNWHRNVPIHNGPSYDTDTNASIGPSTAPWVSSWEMNVGTAKYGGNLSLAPNTEGTFEYAPNFIDFGQVLADLTQLATSLYSLSATGSVTQKNDGLTLTGDGVSALQIFDVGDRTNLSNLTFSNIQEGAHIIINSSATEIRLGGFQGGDQVNSTDIQAKHRDRLLFNFGLAERLDINSFVNGSILAYGADVFGSGHTEGTLIGHSLSARNGSGSLELGYEPFNPYQPDNTDPLPVPAPASWMLLLLGLPVVLWRCKR